MERGSQQKEGEKEREENKRKDKGITELRLQPSPLLIPHGPHPQQDSPPAAVPILEDIGVPRPLDLLVRAIVPQWAPLPLPGPAHAVPAPEHPLLMTGLRAPLGREEVVPPLALDDVRALREAVG